MNDTQKHARNSRVLKRGLPPKALKELALLKEQEEQLSALVVYFDINKIKMCIDEVDIQLLKLSEKRKELVEKRLSCSEEKTECYRKKLIENRNAQAAVIMSNKSLDKLMSAIAQIEELEKLEQLMKEEITV
jgi:hypothetical protein